MCCVTCAAAVVEDANGRCPICRSEANGMVFVPQSYYNQGLNFECNHAGCQALIPFCDAKKHMDECPYRYLMCLGCSQIYKASEQENHQQVCPKRYVRCTEDCGLYVRHDMGRHDCANELLKDTLQKKAYDLQAMEGDEKATAKAAEIFVKLAQMDGCLDVDRQPMTMRDCAIKGLDDPTNPNLWVMLAKIAHDPTDPNGENPPIFLDSQYTPDALMGFMQRQTGINPERAIDMIEDWIEKGDGQRGSHNNSGVYSRLRCLLLAATLGFATGHYVLSVWLDLAKMVCATPPTCQTV